MVRRSTPAMTSRERMYDGYSARYRSRHLHEGYAWPDGERRFVSEYKARQVEGSLDLSRVNLDVILLLTYGRG